MLGKPLTDATSGNAAGPSQAIGRDIGIRIEIRRAQNENASDPERFQLLSKNVNESVAGATGQRREGSSCRQRARQSNVLVLRPRDTHASCSESRDHYFLDRRKWYRFSTLFSSAWPPIVAWTIIDPARC